MKKIVRDKTRALQLLVSLGVPVAMFVTVIGDFAKTSSTVSSDVLALKCYLIVLFFVFIWILCSEYVYFNDLHFLKNPLLDSTLLVCGSFSIARAFESSKNLNDLLLWLCLIGIVLCVWEGYTMKCGYKQYFKENPDSLKIKNMLFHFVRIISRFDLKTGLNHWDEYRYWLILDLFMAVIFFAIYIFKDYLGKPSLVRYIIVVFGMFVILLNLCRYNLVKARALNSLGGT